MIFVDIGVSSTNPRSGFALASVSNDSKAEMELYG